MSQTPKQQEKIMSTTTFDTLAARIAVLEGIVSQQLADKKSTVVRGPTLNQDGSERKKRTLSAYQLFCNTNRAEIQAMLAKAAGPEVKLVRGAALSELARRWNALNVEEKKVWDDKRGAPSGSSDEEPVVVVEEEEQPLPMEYPVVDPIPVEDQVVVPPPEEKPKKKKEKKEKKEKKNEVDIE